MPRTYTREEADEILRRALLTQASDGISHDDLVAAAREVGIPEEAVEAAASQLGEHRSLRERIVRLRQRKRGSFFRHLSIYSIANGGIFVFDQADGGNWFFHYPLIGWGILLLSIGVGQLWPDEERLKQRAERELEREKRKLEKQRAREAREKGGKRDPGSSAKEFEAAVDAGVSALLSAAARAIRSVTPSESGAPGRYRVDPQKKGEAPTPAHEASPEERARRTGRV